MSWALSLLIAAVVTGLAVWLGRRYFALRGARIVECPETKAPAAVSLHAAQAAVGGSLSLSDRSRWPERWTWTFRPNRWASDGTGGSTTAISIRCWKFRSVTVRH